MKFKPHEMSNIEMDMWMLESIELDHQNLMDRLGAEYGPEDIFSDEQMNDWCIRVLGCGMGYIKALLSEEDIQHSMAREAGDE